MPFFFKTLVFILINGVIVLSSITLAFVFDARGISHYHLLFFCGVYAAALTALSMYPLLAMAQKIDRFFLDRKNIHGGSFARLKK